MEILQDDADFPILKELKLEHFQQKYDWDCGISCILMILPTYKRTHLTEHLFDIAKEEGFLKSTWTIDLCYLLKRYNMKFVYYTITLGVNPGYSKNSFYSKVLTKDQTRVVNRFKNAKSEGVVVKKASVTLSQILHHLAEGWPVIVLTDASSLECTACRANRRTLRLRKCIPWAPAYIGHYVALCGYSMQTQSVFYRIRLTMTEFVSCLLTIWRKLASRMELMKMSFSSLPTEDGTSNMMKTRVKQVSFADIKKSRNSSTARV